MKDKVTVVLFLILIYSFALLNIILEDQKVSVAERRNLMNVASLKEDFHENFDSYLTDQFPFRETFLQMNQVFNRYLLNNREYQDVTLKDDSIVEKLYPLNEKSLNHFISKMNDLKTNYFSNCNVYYAILPDKSYFLDEKKYLRIDYSYLYQRLQEINIPSISLKDSFQLDDYYKTDIHIKQPSYFKILPSLGQAFHFDVKQISYQENLYSHFRGASFYKVPFHKEDSLIYLTSDLDVTVKHFEYEDDFLYDVDALTTGDSYNVFLSGPSSLIEIENNQAPTDKELILFRDSFGSSLAPLLIPYYKKITLVDLRYMNMKFVKEYLNFDHQDVLILYSTLIVNNSFLLKV